MLIHHPQLKKLIAVERETSIKHSNSYRLRTVGFGYIYIYIYIYTYTHIYIYIYVCEFFTQISDRLKLSSDLCIRVFLLTHTLSHSLTQKTTTSYNVVFRVLVSLRLCEATFAATAPTTATKRRRKRQEKKGGALEQRVRAKVRAKSLVWHMTTVTDNESRLTQTSWQQTNEKIVPFCADVDLKCESLKL